LVEENGPPKPDGLRRGEYRDTVIGCDVAKHTDWTVLIAMEVQTGRCLAMERFNLLDWPVQRERIAGFVKKCGGQLVMDATGVGDPVFDDLRREFPDTEGYRITAQSKRELVQGLEEGLQLPQVLVEDLVLERAEAQELVGVLARVAILARVLEQE
jgi:hypothetical protein